MWLPLAPRMQWVARCHEGGAGIAGARAVWRWSAAQGLRALGRFVDAGWQDLRAVHDSRGPCSEKRPFLARSSRGVSSNGDLRGISDAWRAYLAKASPFSDAWRANLAANWRFSRPRPLSGCMERKTCHGLPPGNAPRRNLATARPPGTHRARILPLPVRPRAHQGAIPPPSDAGERILRAFCHRRAPGNASRHNLATTGRPRRTPRATMCYGSRLAHGRGSERPPFAYATRHPDAAGLRVLQVVRALAVAQPADCRVAAERVVNIAKLVSVPQRRSATTPCATIPCAAAPQRHALQHHDAMHRTRRFCRR